MPTAAQILQTLALIANQNTWLSIAWHAAIALALVAVLAGWKPSLRVTGMIMALPLLSVSLLAWRYGNPFNGMLFLTAALLLGGLALRLDKRSISIAAGWTVWAGIAMLAFGWVYPHFLENAGWLTYLYASPVGLIPCPTLSATIGLVLLVDGLSSRSWSLILAGFGLFYGLFGTFRLHVWLDIGLVVGSLALAIRALALTKAGLK
ncbi:MAG: hypothetical protein AB1439_12175 [candidate division FCPU426 bacterium]